MLMMSGVMKMVCSDHFCCWLLVVCCWLLLVDVGDHWIDVYVAWGLVMVGVGCCWFVLGGVGCC